MSDFLNKVITIILIFVLLVLAPLLISYMSTDMVTERLVLNDVTQFIDKTTDKALITQQDLDELYMAVNSHGNSFDVDVYRYQLVEEELPGDKTKTLYLKLDDVEILEAAEADEKDEYKVKLNIKDVVKVHVEESALSPGKRLFWTVLRVDKGKFSFSLAGTVR